MTCMARACLGRVVSVAKEARLHAYVGARGVGAVVLLEVSCGLIIAHQAIQTPRELVTTITNLTRIWTRTCIDLPIALSAGKFSLGCSPFYSAWIGSPMQAGGHCWQDTQFTRTNAPIPSRPQTLGLAGPACIFDQLDICLVATLPIPLCGRC